MKHVTFRRSGGRWKPVKEQRSKPPVDYNAWRFPRELHRLRQWLAIRYVDVGSVKTARQALFLTIKLAEIRMAMPERGAELPALLALQEALTGRKTKS